MNLELLKHPFAPADVSWRIGQAGKTRDGKIWAKVLAYIDNRNIQDRLDAVCGPENWKNEYTKGPEGGVLCGLSIRVGSAGEWVTKWDGAENSDIEPIKGGLSDSMKRAAVQWGIGRYLYELGENWAEVLSSKAEGSHYANCKIKADGKEEWVNFHWLPPRGVLPGQASEPPKPQSKPAPKAKEVAAQHGMKTADELPLPPGTQEDTAYSKALKTIADAVRAHDKAALTTISKRIKKSVESGSISRSEDAMLVTELSLAEKKIDAILSQPDSAAA